MPLPQNHPKPLRRSHPLIYSETRKKKTLRNDHPHLGHSPEDIMCALKKPHLSDDALIKICTIDTTLDGTPPPAGNLEEFAPSSTHNSAAEL